MTWQQGCSWDEQADICVQGRPDRTQGKRRPQGRRSILSDIEPYQNMKDRGWITSRSQHREFLRRNNFVEVGTSQDHLFK